MQKISGLSIAMLIIITLLSCRQSQTIQSKTNSNAKLEVLYFHVTERCPACLAIENNTKKVLDDNFKTQMDNGIIKFTSYNIEEKTNKSLVEKYQISYLTLLIIKSDGTKTDFTNTAFQYADAKPAKFEELLKAEIDKNLK
ncbi:MAG TPA: nitrophenyl compound nitroreductase subunit ArsF family protein [Bacteroidales bacterium]|nr:nitrophenyl compound nitroreductase subunit ArsF family protein [Bacteroidales bacterium]